MGETPKIATVVIGRNEGARLERCLKSLQDVQGPTIYVDSASTDGSVELARSHGAMIVELNPARPMNAARARKEGFERMRRDVPEAEFVQFIDGDCELVDGWIDQALAVLIRQPKVGAVGGRRRERYPDASPYNALADLEWDTPVGEAAACGGDSIMRVDAYEQAGGFDPWMIAHEEPDLCRRMREAGWTIQRIDADMTIHDAALSEMTQLWRRAKRGGFGYSQYVAKNGDWSGPEARGLFRAFFWGVLIPVAALVVAFISPRLLLVVPLIYGLQWVRLFLRDHERLPAAIRRTRATSMILTKFAEAIGAMQFSSKRLAGLPMEAILYK